MKRKIETAGIVSLLLIGSCNGFVSTLAFGNDTINDEQDYYVHSINQKSTIPLEEYSGNNNPTGGLTNSPWPMFRHDLNHTGLSPYDTSGNPGTLKWNFTTMAGVLSSPAIGFDGTIYVGSLDPMNANAAAKLYAINPNGTQRWNFTTGAGIYSSPAIDSDGTIYVGSYNNKLYAIHSDGTQKWNFTANENITWSSPAIGSDGTIYIGSLDNKLYAINPDGSQKWNFTTDHNVYSSPAIGSDGTIYVGFAGNKLYAIYPDGSQKWNFTTKNTVWSSPAIGSDNTIYVGSFDHKLYAINPNGTQKWNFTTGNLVYSSPAIGADGTIYVGGWDNKLYAINPDGSQKWNFTTGDSVWSSPAIGFDGTIYIGSLDNKLHAINPDGTQKWNFTTGWFIYSSPAIAPDGTIYIGSWDKNLYAIGTTSTTIVPPEASCLGVQGYLEGTTGIMHITDHTPDLNWTYYDGDSAPQTQYEVRVGTSSGSSDMWLSGVQAGAKRTVAYGGLPLLDGTDNWFGVRVYDGTNWSAWNETQFHMNTILPPTAPVTPSDGEIIPASTTQTVSWTFGGIDPEGDAVIHYWEVSQNDDTFAPVNIIASGSTISTISASFITLSSTTYYWRVNVTDSWEFSNYGNTPPGYWMFNTTKTANTPPEARHLGVQGYLNATAGIMHIVNHTPNLNWTYNDADGDLQTAYNVTVWDSTKATLLWFNNSTSTSVIDIYNVTGTAVQNLVDGMDYWFNVRVYDGEDWGVWNETQFHMNAILEPTAPITPPDTANIPASTTQTVSWTSNGADPEGDAVTYYWQVSQDDNTFPSANIIASGITAGTTSTAFATMPSTTYYWRVNATDSWEFSNYGNTPPGYWMFTTTANIAPEAQYLGVQGYLKATAGIMNITDHTPDLNWTCYDADGDPQSQYEIRVGTASGLSDAWAPGVQAGAITTATYAGAALIDGTDYWFGIRIFDGISWSVWNETQFHMNTILAPIIPVTPPDAANVAASATQTVSWTSGDTDPEGDSVTYYWEVSQNDNTFAPSNIIALGTSAGTTSTPFATLPSVMYYWRVNATDSWEFSNYGNTPPGYWIFITTANTVPEVQNLGAQGYLEGTTGIMHLTDHEPELNWTYYDAESDAQIQYEVRVGTTSGLSDMWAPGVQTGALINITYAGATLIDGSDYWFGVRVRDGTDWSVWNETQFHMNAILAPKTPVIPLDTANISASATQVVSWTSGGADSEDDPVNYYWEVAIDTEFTTIVASGKTINTNSTSFTTSPSTIYYWRVYANDSWESSKYSNAPLGYWTFTTTSVSEEPPLVGFNYKPIIALIFILILGFIGTLAVLRRPLKFKNESRRKLYTWLTLVLSFMVVEGLTGIISLFTGFLGVPPLFDAGLFVDLAILVTGIIVFSLQILRNKEEI